MVGEVCMLSLSPVSKCFSSFIYSLTPELEAVQPPKTLMDLQNYMASHLRR
jgi:hypothetical protein